MSEQLTIDECAELLTQIGKAMRTDAAILTVLRVAADEIQRLRKKERGEEKWLSRLWRENPATNFTNYTKWQRICEIRVIRGKDSRSFW